MGHIESIIFKKFTMHLIKKKFSHVHQTERTGTKLNVFSFLKVWISLLSFMLAEPTKTFRWIWAFSWPDSRQNPAACWHYSYCVCLSLLLQTFETSIYRCHESAASMQWLTRNIIRIQTYHAFSNFQISFREVISFTEFSIKTETRYGVHIHYQNDNFSLDSKDRCGDKIPKDLNTETFLESRGV